MTNISIKQVTLTKDYRSNGYYLGEFVRQSFKFILETLQALGPYEQDAAEIKKMLSTYCPQLVEELKGIQEGLQLTEEKTLQLFSGYDMPEFKGMGCTTLITGNYYVRNYDFSPSVYDHLFIKQKQMCGNSQFLIGRLDGMNADGLVVGLHFVNNKHYKKGFLCSVIVRIILEMCSNVDEAVQLLQKIPHAACYNYSLLDRNGTFAIVEASPYGNEVIFGKNALCCVNMFQKHNMKKYNRQNITSSVDRLHALSAYEAAHAKVVEQHKLFSDPASPLFYTDYEDFFGTLHTVSYVPQANQVLLTPAGGDTTTINV